MDGGSFALLRPDVLHVLATRAHMALCCGRRVPHLFGVFRRSALHSLGGGRRSRPLILFCWIAALWVTRYSPRHTVVLSQAATRMTIQRLSSRTEAEVVAALRALSEEERAAVTE